MLTVDVNLVHELHAYSPVRPKTMQVFDDKSLSTILVIYMYSVT